MYDIIPNPKMISFCKWEYVCHVQWCETLCTVVGDQKRNKEKIFEPGLGARDKREDMERKKILSWQNVQVLVTTEWESEDVGEQEWLHCSSPRLP